MQPTTESKRMGTVLSCRDTEVQIMLFGFSAALSCPVMRCCIHFSRHPCFCQVALARSTARDGSGISCIRSQSVRASKSLIGSAFGRGIPWTICCRISAFLSENSIPCRRSRCRIGSLSACQVLRPDGILLLPKRQEQYAIRIHILFFLTAEQCHDTS